MKTETDLRHEKRAGTVRDLLTGADKILITDREWGAVSGVSPRTISRMRSGKVPSDRNLNLLRTALIKEAISRGYSLSFSDS